MFETGIRQARMAMSMVWGRPINPRNVERLVGDALATLATFGEPGEDVQQLLDGPLANPEVRQAFQNQALRRTARRLARVSPFYARRFRDVGLDPRSLTVEAMPDLPATVKGDVVAAPQDFVTAGSAPYLTTRTTGTTGRPAEIWLSRYEIDLWSALSALAGLLRGEISPRDHIQMNISSRATAAVQLTLKVCGLVGARSRMLGLVPPDESLDGLLAGGDEAPTILSTYPSYLARLVDTARFRGLGPDDFRLRRIDCGGEVLSPALARVARETFGPQVVTDGFAMTEVLPVSGRVCSQGHLHHDLNMGFVEVVDLESGRPAAPGDLGTVVITPYYPYRECMPVFRYDTRDVVRVLPDQALSCEHAAIPATSLILGKADHLLRLREQVVTVRELVEELEGLPANPWPARFGARVTGEQLVLTVPGELADAVLAGELRRRLEGRGVPVDITVAPPSDPLPALRPVRADLLETTFTARS